MENPQAIDDRRKGLPRKNGNNRRRYPRVKVEVEGFCSRHGKMLLANGSNLNLRGVRLDTSIPDFPESQLTVRLMLPQTSEMLKVFADVVWANVDEKAGRPGMGLKFSGLELWQLEKISGCLLAAGGQAVYPGLYRA